MRLIMTTLLFGAILGSTPTQALTDQEIRNFESRIAELTTELRHEHNVANVITPDAIIQNACIKDDQTKTHILLSLYSRMNLTRLAGALAYESERQADYLKNWNSLSEPYQFGSNTYHITNQFTEALRVFRQKQFITEIRKALSGPSYAKRTKTIREFGEELDSNSQYDLVAFASRFFSKCTLNDAMELLNNKNKSPFYARAILYFGLLLKHSNVILEFDLKDLEFAGSKEAIKKTKQRISESQLTHILSLPEIQRAFDEDLAYFTSPVKTNNNNDDDDDDNSDEIQPPSYEEIIGNRTRDPQLKSLFGTLDNMHSDLRQRITDFELQIAEAPAGSEKRTLLEKQYAALKARITNLGEAVETMYAELLTATEVEIAAPPAPTAPLSDDDVREGNAAALKKGYHVGSIFVPLHDLTTRAAAGQTVAPGKGLLPPAQRPYPGTLIRLAKPATHYAELLQPNAPEFMHITFCMSQMAHDITNFLGIMEREQESTTSPDSFPAQHSYLMPPVTLFRHPVTKALLAKPKTLSYLMPSLSMQNMYGADKKQAITEALDHAFSAAAAKGVKYISVDHDEITLLLMDCGETFMVDLLATNILTEVFQKWAGMFERIDMLNRTDENSVYYSKLTL